MTTRPNTLPSGTRCASLLHVEPVTEARVGPWGRPETFWIGHRSLRRRAQRAEETYSRSFGGFNIEPPVEYAW